MRRVSFDRQAVYAKNGTGNGVGVVIDLTARKGTMRCLRCARAPAFQEPPTNPITWSAKSSKSSKSAVRALPPLGMDVAGLVEELAKDFEEEVVIESELQVPAFLAGSCYEKFGTPPKEAPGLVGFDLTEGERNLAACLATPVEDFDEGADVRIQRSLDELAEEQELEEEVSLLDTETFYFEREEVRSTPRTRARRGRKSEEIRIETSDQEHDMAIPQTQSVVGNINPIEGLLKVALIGLARVSGPIATKI